MRQDFNYLQCFNAWEWPRQGITLTNADLLSIGSLETNSKIRIKIIPQNISSAKFLPFCSGLYRSSDLHKSDYNTDEIFILDQALPIEDYVASSRYLRQGWVITSYSKLRDVITYPCLRYLLLATKSSIIDASSGSKQYMCI